MAVPRTSIFIRLHSVQKRIERSIAPWWTHRVLWTRAFLCWQNRSHLKKCSSRCLSRRPCSASVMSWVCKQVLPNRSAFNEPPVSVWRIADAKRSTKVSGSCASTWGLAWREELIGFHTDALQQRRGVCLNVKKILGVGLSKSRTSLRTSLRYSRWANRVYCSWRCCIIGLLIYLEVGRVESVSLEIRLYGRQNGHNSQYNVTWMWMFFLCWRDIDHTWLFPPCLLKGISGPQMIV